MRPTFRHLADTSVFGPPRPRKGNRFRAPYDRTLAQLDTELEHLRATDAWVQVVLASGEADVRRDGALRSRADVRHPGAVLTVVSRDHGTLVYPCDAFESRWSGEPPSWQVNLRAIVLGLEHLRRLDDYGVVRRGEQYAGFRAIGSGTAMPAGMTAEAAARLLCDLAGWSDIGDLDAVLTNEEGSASDAFRRAAQTHHPDHGGDPEVFARLIEARDLLVR